MKNILIPTDFSLNARNALRYALSYFGSFSANFYILHVDSSDKSAVEAPSSFTITLEQNSSSVKELLKKEVEFCKEYSTNNQHKFIPLVCHKSLVDSVRSCVKERSIEYIVMGTHGASKTINNKIGSTTYEIISKVKCPTIAVPEEAVYKDFKNIALPTDYNNWDKNRMFINLYETIVFKKANLHILQIRNNKYGWTYLQEDTKNFLIDLLRKVNFELHTLPNKAIDVNMQEFITQLDIDMIALVGRNINFVQKLLFQPKAKEINYKQKVPFLILHD